MKFGLEFEFFVKRNDNGEVVIAQEATYNLDANPVVGELRTIVHSDLVSAVFELKKLIYEEKKRLAQRGYSMLIASEVILTKDKLRQLRATTGYSKTPLLEKSIYPKGALSKILGKGLFKASLQINMSKEYTSAVEFTDSKGKRYYVNKQFSEVFDYVSIISKFDICFANEIKEAKRVKGVYAIKDGVNGSRVEYRSLPNTVFLEDLLSINL